MTIECVGGARKADPSQNSRNKVEPPKKLCKAATASNEPAVDLNTADPVCNPACPLQRNPGSTLLVQTSCAALGLARTCSAVTPVTPYKCDDYVPPLACTQHCCHLACTVCRQILLVRSTETRPRASGSSSWWSFGCNCCPDADAQSKRKT